VGLKNIINNKTIYKVPKHVHKVTTRAPHSTIKFIRDKLQNTTAETNKSSTLLEISEC